MNYVIVTRRVKCKDVHGEKFFILQINKQKLIQLEEMETSNNTNAMIKKVKWTLGLLVLFIAFTFAIPFYIVEVRD